MTQASRVPPNDLRAEREVLGSCLLDNAILDELDSIVSAEDFYSDANIVSNI